LIWAAGHGALSYFTEQGFWASFASGCGGLVAGWTTASLLARIARFGAGSKIMMLTGLIFGVVVSSGAVFGLKYVFDWFGAGVVKIDWESLGRFLLSGAALPAAVLGLVTGAYVRAKIPRDRD
jgi:hypothetical protein